MMALIIGALPFQYRLRRSRRMTRYLQTEERHDHSFCRQIFLLVLLPRWGSWGRTV